MTTDDELRKLIALGEKATARPWSADWDTAKFTHNFKIEYCGWSETPTISGASVSEIEPQVEADRLYMEAAANLALEIAAELIAAREEIRKLRNEIIMDDLATNEFMDDTINDNIGGDL